MILKNAANKLFKMREDAARKRPGADSGFDPHEKPFLDHLEDLRQTLIRMGATLAVVTILCFAFHMQIFELLQLPAKFVKLDDGSRLWDNLELFTLDPPEIIILMLKLSFFTAVVLSMPALVYFAFQFILPGLRQVEKKMIIPGAGVGFILFLIGVSFAYFLAAPIALKFFYVFQNERIGNLNPADSALEKEIGSMPLLGVDGVKIAPVGKEPKKDAKAKPATEGGEATVAANDPLSADMKLAIRSYMIDLLAVQEGKNMVLRYDEERDKIILAHSKGATVSYQIGKYFVFITRLMLVFGLSFQLPVIVTILVKLELLTARVMRSTRTYAWVIIMVAAAVLTPPDLMTLALLAGPMIILYEICVIIASVMERSREKKELAEEEERRARLDKLYSKSPSDLSEDEKQELHKHEIETYEREHANRYDDDGHEYDEHGHLIGYDPHHDQSLEGGDHYDHDHDDSWHDEHHYYHDGEEEGDEPIEPEHDKPDSEDDEGKESSSTSSVPGAQDQSDSDAADEKASDDDESHQSDDHDVDDHCEPSGPVVDMNHATREELMDLPGVDDWMADMIVDHRPYESFEQLEEIVGEEKVNEWMERLMLG